MYATISSQAAKADDGADEHRVDHRDCSCRARLTRDGGVGVHDPAYIDREESERRGVKLLVRSEAKRSDESQQ